VAKPILLLFYKMEVYTLGEQVLVDSLVIQILRASLPMKMATLTNLSQDVLQHLNLVS